MILKLTELFSTLIALVLHILARERAQNVSFTFKNLVISICSNILLFSSHF